jgi:hypothetical protein
VRAVIVIRVIRIQSNRPTSQSSRMSLAPSRMHSANEYSVDRNLF